MSSKFFTWTKGDKNVNTDGLRLRGIVPIPAECITINGFEYGEAGKRTSRQRRPPLVLDIDDHVSPDSRLSHRTKSTFALQDAAVKSATCLMAAVTDMLRTPQLSAHLAAQHYHGLSTPTLGRPRSRTVPATPIVEPSPPIIAELPGSFYLDEHSSIPPASSEKSLWFAKSSASIAGNSDVSPWIYRNNPYDTEPSSARHPSSTTTLCPPYTARPRSYSESRCPSSEKEVLHSAQEDTLSAWTRRSAMKISQNDPWADVQIPERLSLAQQPPSAPSSSHQPTLPPVRFPPYPTDSEAADNEAALLDQIITMRASHDAHISSLKAAHDRELETLQAYVRALEVSRSRDVPITPMEKKALKIDTSRPRPPVQGTLSSNASTTTLVSLETALECQRRKSQDSVAEVNALKRELSGARRASSETENIVRERDELRGNVERQDRKLAQFNDLIRRAKENEEALQNALVDLKSRLDMANSARVDALEGLHLATTEIELSIARETLLRKEVEGLRQQNAAARVEKEVSRASIAENGTARPQVPDRSLSESEVIKDLRQKLEEQTTQIAKSETASQSVANSEQLKTKVEGLEETLVACKMQLVSVRADCERYHDLYHNELRRKGFNEQRAETFDQQRALTSPSPTATSSQASQRVVSHRHSVTALKQSSRTRGQSNPAPIQEQNHEDSATEELLLHGHDAMSQHPITPLRTSQTTPSISPETKPRRASANSTPTRTPGLGITGMTTPNTPSSRSHHATYPPALMPGRAQHMDRSSTAQAAPAVGKALPHPPKDLTFSPSQTRAIERGESTRSTSDSIISSYAKLPSSFTPRWTSTPPTSKFYQPPSHQADGTSSSAASLQTRPPSARRSMNNMRIT